MNTIPRGTHDDWRPIRLATICRALEFGWQWWTDPRHPEKMYLKSPGHSLWEFTARNGTYLRLYTRHDYFAEAA